MKGRRFTAFLFAALLSLSLLAVPAGAVVFTDMVGHWAQEDVEALAAEGIVNGTTPTTFSPGNRMTACEALLFCSRATGLTNVDKTKIYNDYLPVAQRLLPNETVSWASQEMAICLATGIISETELQALTTSGNILRSISRENLAMYLVRAMQLSPLANSLTSYNMSFADAASISPALRPYVYLLNMYGIVRGDTTNRFLPQGSVTRAEMATMLRRAIRFMNERGIYAELPKYTDFEWIGGTITAVSPSGGGVTVLTLDGGAAGSRSVSLPADVQIYENNMLTTTAALRVGQYVRVNLNTRGTPYAVRVGGALTTYSGAITSLTQEHIAISVSGVSKAFDIDRFTEVQIGKVTGGGEIIDPNAGYTEATCRTDAQGHLVRLQLSGGVSDEEGILAGVELNLSGGQNLLVTGFDGTTKQYLLPAGATVTVNGLPGTMTARYVGNYVSLQVAGEGINRLEGVAVDSVTEYIQGSLRSYSTSGRYDTVTIAGLTNGRTSTYDVSSNAAIYYEGETVRLGDLRRNCFVTICLTNNEVTLLDAYPSSNETEGVLESISYGSTTVLTLRLRDDQRVTFSMNLNDLPDIYRDDRVSSIDKLVPGDDLVVTVRYNEIEVIEAYSQSANVSGIINRITLESRGVTLSLTTSDGQQVSYTVADTVVVTQDGASVSVYSLKPDYRVSLVVNGTSVVSIRVDRATSTDKQVTGTVLEPKLSDETLNIILENGSLLKVDVAYARFILANGDAVNLEYLQVNDAVQIYGRYSGSTFVAELVIVL